MSSTKQRQIKFGYVWQEKCFNVDGEAVSETELHSSCSMQAILIYTNRWEGDWIVSYKCLYCGCVRKRITDHKVKITSTRRFHCSKCEQRIEQRGRVSSKRAFEREKRNLEINMTW